MGKSTPSAPSYVPAPAAPEIDFEALMMPIVGMMEGMASQQAGMMDMMMLNMETSMSEPITVEEPEFDYGAEEAFLADQAEEQLTALDKMRMGRAATIKTTPELAGEEPDTVKKSLLGA